MDELATFKSRALRHGVCASYLDKWDAACSKKQIADMALSVQGAEYVCQSMAEGWGISPGYIANDFGSYINGRYKAANDGYTSRVYCKYNGKITVDATLIIIIDSIADIDVPPNAMCEVFCCGPCRLAISGGGRATFVCYGGDVALSGRCGRMKVINK